jgi:hypothetical protein
VFTGRIVNVRHAQDDSWYIDLRSAAGLLVSRASQTTGQGALFYDLPSTSTTLTSTVTSSSTTISVADATGARAETGGRYLLEVTPTTPDLDPYLVQCNAAVRDDVHRSSVPVFGASMSKATGSLDERQQGQDLRLHARPPGRRDSEGDLLDGGREQRECTTPCPRRGAWACRTASSTTTSAT